MFLPCSSHGAEQAAHQPDPNRLREDIHEVGGTTNGSNFTPPQKERLTFHMTNLLVNPNNLAQHTRAN